ncbi:hypothetical protein GGI06_000206 [Coemansia sp. S85]|nr:hypothetical protein GGI06_000206 [Coemansia sp. S85]
MVPESPLQLLPTHVVRAIVNHIVAETHIRSDFLVRYDGAQVELRAYRGLLRPLLGTCDNFRQVAYPLYCRYLTMELNRDAYSKYVTQYASTGCLRVGRSLPECLGHPTHHLAKELDIEFSVKGLFSGMVPKMLSCMPYKHCAFPMAYKLTIRIVADKSDQDGAIEESDFEANVGSFVQWVTRALPKVSEVWVQAKTYEGPFDMDGQHFGNLVSQLFRLVRFVRVDLLHKKDVPLQLQLADHRDLVHIGCHNREDLASFVLLARQCAQTLQYLDLYFDQPDGLVSLIQMANNDFVSYPCLHFLKLCGHFEGNWLQRPAFTGAVPFPALRRALLLVDYPFGDDVLFRGNAATLEVLRLQLDSVGVSILTEHNVFTPTSHPKLVYVKTGYLGPAPGAFETPTMFLQFLLSIGPRAPVRDAQLTAYGAELSPALSLLGSCKNIRVLMLPCVHPQLLDVLTLIKSLPLLSDLTMSSVVRELEVAGVDDGELPAYLIANYSLLSKRFGSLHWDYIPYEYDPNMALLAEYALLLALVCPNFSLVTLCRIKVDAYEQELEKVIASDKFKEHASGLQRLRVTQHSRY